MALQRTAVNPVSWSIPLGFNQAEVVSGHTTTVYISGQTAMDEKGKPLHDGDIADQLRTAVDNLDRVLTAAGLTFAHLVRLNVYTTDIDGLLPHYDTLAARLGAAQVAPTSSMLPVSRLAIPGQLVELEGTAVA